VCGYERLKSRDYWGLLGATVNSTIPDGSRKKPAISRSVLNRVEPTEEVSCEEPHRSVGAGGGAARHKTGQVRRS